MKLTDEILEVVAAVLARPDVYPLPDAIRREATEWLLTGEILRDLNRGNPKSSKLLVHALVAEDRGYAFLIRLRNWYHCEWGPHDALDRLVREIRADLKIFER